MHAYKAQPRASTVIQGIGRMNYSKKGNGATRRSVLLSNTFNIEFWRRTCAKMVYCCVCVCQSEGKGLAQLRTSLSVMGPFQEHEKSTYSVIQPYQKKSKHANMYFPLHSKDVISSLTVKQQNLKRL
uniref:Uncharacterized protein n=1 Tax=Entomoneis paludosa TaxID=265537 RepID=A0A7S3DRV3_9STRA|mmetsp:Transcript_3190/g.6559  ORF Transcript_3190/g.6559 Transcript_3190/m.6559 type:complete len:127 (-) Transcript_3190:254-634(-)